MARTASRRRAATGTLFVYSAQGRPFTVNLGKISGAKVNALWFNPRTGTSTLIGLLENTGTREFTCPAQGFGSDWVLVLDDASKNFPAPGSAATSSRPSV